MNQLLHYLLESSACLLVFYLLYALVLRREKCFTYNRFYLLLTPLLALVLPLLELELPLLRQPAPLPVYMAEKLPPIATEQLSPVTNSTNTAYPVAEEPPFDYTFLLLLLYVAGVGFFSFRLGRQLYLLHQFKRQTQAEQFYWQNIPVHKTNGWQPTFSFGNCIFWDNSQPLNATETEQILQHEAIHVRQKHTQDILYLEVLKSIFWFNPLFHFYQKALINTHEFIADAAVLRITNLEKYASLLVKQLFNRLEFSFGNYFSQSLTAKRLKMMQQTHRRPNRVKQLLALPVLVVLVLVLSSNTTSVPDTIYSDYSSYYNKSQRPVPESFVEPMFPGGKEAMYTFLAKNLKYPAENLTTSRDWFNFVISVEIDEKGVLKILEHKNIHNPKASLEWGADPSLKHEIYRALRAMPAQWRPAFINGKPVASRYQFEFLFSKTNQLIKEPTTLHQEIYELGLDNVPVITSRPIDVVLQDKNLSKSIHNYPTITYHQPKTTPVAIEVNKSGLVKVENTLTYEHKIQLPLFPGGHYEMYKYLHQNIRFGKYINNFGSNAAGAFTAVDIQVDEKGRVSTETSLMDDDFAREIKQAVLNMPLWQPAEVDDRPTASTYNLILMFKKDVEEGTPMLKEKLESYSNGNLKLTGILYGKRPYTLPNQPNEPVLTVVEKKPEFPGGIEKMYDFLNKQIQYPEAARQAKLEGMVIAKFIVTREGKILETRIDSHLSPETDAEILRVINLMPTWTPGKHNGELVNAEYTMPFKFRLNK